MDDAMKMFCKLFRANVKKTQTTRLDPYQIEIMRYQKYGQLVIGIVGVKTYR